VGGCLNGEAFTRSFFLFLSKYFLLVDERIQQLIYQALSILKLLGHLILLILNNNYQQNQRSECLFLDLALQISIYQRLFSFLFYYGFCDVFLVYPCSFSKSNSEFSISQFISKGFLITFNWLSISISPSMSEGVGLRDSLSDSMFLLRLVIH
jgi:hypothetical protein